MLRSVHVLDRSQLLVDGRQSAQVLHDGGIFTDERYRDDCLDKIVLVADGPLQQVLHHHALGFQVDSLELNGGEFIVQRLQACQHRLVVSRLVQPDIAGRFPELLQGFSRLVQALFRLFYLLRKEPERIITGGLLAIHVIAHIRLGGGICQQQGGSGRT